MSYEEYLRDPGIPEHTEWVDGEVTEMMSVSNKHAQLVGYLARLIGMYVELRELGEIRMDPFQMRPTPSSNGRAPDLIFVVRTKLGSLRPQYLEGPADVVIEVTSPGTEAVDRGDKFYEYEAGGVPEYWILDPVREVAEFYVRDESGVFRSANVQPDGEFESAALDGFRLKVEWLWTRRPVLRVLRELGELPA